MDTISQSVVRKDHSAKTSGRSLYVGDYAPEGMLFGKILRAERRAQKCCEIDALCDYRRKKAEYQKPQTGRFRRGIGMSLQFHGGGFTGSGEQDIIKGVVRSTARACA